MITELYNPFLTYNFSNDACYLTGKPMETTEMYQVFPEWLMERYQLHDQNFKLLGDGFYSKYKDIQVPIAKNEIGEKLLKLDQEIEQAFIAGFHHVKALPQDKLFLWMTKMVYGILYHDFCNAKKQLVSKGEQFKLSRYLERRIECLHLMTQAIVTPLKWKNFIPYSIEIVQVEYSKDVFNYKDETNKLNFSLSMNGFGIVACLQDNGLNKEYHKNLTSKIGETVLHPIQFEELCSRFLYSNYLLNFFPAYSVYFDDKNYVIQNDFKLEHLGSTPLFNLWEDEMYGQVLANYWKPWGIGMKDIIIFPNPPISFLESDYSESLIKKEDISLPF